jgi:integrase
VDLAESRFRIRQGKTATARRWVAVPEWLIDEIAKTCPPDDRTPERRVFVGFSPDVAKNVMARACKAAGIPHFHPHDLRHRYASEDSRGRSGDGARGAVGTLEKITHARCVLPRPHRFGRTSPATLTL